MPANMPNGVPMAAATSVMRNVPTMALNTPPPLSPMGAGALVKKSQFRYLTPEMKMCHTMTRSTAMSRRADAATRTPMAPFLIFRLIIAVLRASG